MGEKERNEGEGGIKVTDKRRFGREGEGGFGGGQDDSPGQREEAAQSDSNVEGGEVSQKEADAGASGVPGGEMPRMDFATFVLSLATSAQVHLGAIPNPATGKQERELSLAKQTIDILGIIELKTKGNLDDTERRLLDHVLFDLRMMYVDMSKGNDESSKVKGES